MSSAAHVDDGGHSAVNAALGFYYQSLYGLLSIVRASHDDAAACLERLDDVEILTNGQSLLSQLKHSLSKKPAAVTLSSIALWKTLKAWIDVLPAVSLDDTRFQLVTVAPLSSGSPLEVLLDDRSSRTHLLALLQDEAQRVVGEHLAGKKAKKQPPPHADRVSSCVAYLELNDIVREKLLSRITVQPAASNINEIQKDIAKELKHFPPERREAITEKLIEWWDLQVVYSFCDKRERQEHLASAPQLAKAGKDHADHRLKPQIRIEAQAEFAVPDIADGNADTQLTTVGFGASRVEHPGLEHPEFEFTNASLHPQQQAVVRPARIVDALQIDYPGLD